MSLLHCLMLSSILFTLGVVGVLTRRHVIALLLSIELMINAAIINFIAFSHFGPGANNPEGTIAMIFIIALTAAEMVTALAIVIALYKKSKTLDITQMDGLRG